MALVSARPFWIMSAYKFKRVGENLFIHEVSGRYYSIIKKNGIQQIKSLKTKIKSIAQARLFNRKMAVGASNATGTSGSTPYLKNIVPDAVLEAKKQKLAESTVKSFEKHLGYVAKSLLGIMKLGKIESEHVKRYLEGRPGRSSHLELIYLRKLFQIGIEKGWCWFDPTKDVSLPEHKAKKIHIPTREDVQRVLKFLREYPFHANEGFKAADFVEFLCLSGVRMQGAQSIRWEDINFEKGYFRVTEKRNKTRDVNLFPTLRKFLESKQAKSGLLFPGGDRTGKRIKHTYDPKKALLRAFEKTGVKHFSFHACRHFFATECLEFGISPSVIAGWLGHSDNGILVMKLYGNHIRRLHFEQEAEKVDIQFSRAYAETSTNQYQIS